VLEFCQDAGREYHLGKQPWEQVDLADQDQIVERRCVANDDQGRRRARSACTSA
jgi:hypothetical protein